MKIQTWIMSTTHIDRDNERMAKSALDGMAIQVNSKYIPQLLEHDWNRQVWIVLYAEVFQLNDWEYALWSVIGLFTSENEKDKYKVWSKNKDALKYKSYLNTHELIKLSDNNNTELIEREEVNDYKDSFGFWEQLKKYLNSTNVTPDWRVYKTKWFIWWFWSTSIVLYPKDHDNPQHFHVISKQHKLNAKFDLNTFEYISTKHWKINNKLKKKVKQFLLDTPEVVKKLKSEYIRMR